MRKRESKGSDPDRVCPLQITICAQRLRAEPAHWRENKQERAGKIELYVLLARLTKLMWTHLQLGSFETVTSTITAALHPVSSMTFLTLHLDTKRHGLQFLQHLLICFLPDRSPWCCFWSAGIKYLNKVQKELFNCFGLHK